MEHNMILSASGWRKVFAESGNEQDTSPNISNDDIKIAIVAASVFFDYLCEKTNLQNPVITIGMDTRPTGPAITEAMIRILIKKGAIIQFTGISSAPEIMAFARKLDGFIYISASHNPIGHNGIKFGLNDGGVLCAAENAILVNKFLDILKDDKQTQDLYNKAFSVSSSELKDIYDIQESSKHNSLNAYRNFVNETISDTKDNNEQILFFNTLKESLAQSPIGVVCDFNGSSRHLCIDKEYFNNLGITFYSINENQIVHEIIPEAENLVHVAKEMERLQAEGHKEVILGYMPDCDGDRGNIVYWDSHFNKAIILKAQEVFSLSVLAELTYSIWKNKNNPSFKPAIAVNCPTSMRINEIAQQLGAQVFRSEVGEANVVNLAREKRNQGYTVKILGEGSNGGTITYPANVRDPLNTVFAIIKLLTIKQDGLYQLWCNRSNTKYKNDFTLTDVLDSLPKYVTTGVSESRAILKVNTTDHSKLKANFQKEFEKSYKRKATQLKKDYGITNYVAVITNGTKETVNVKDFSLSGKGGLKIIFKNKDDENIAFIWMRGSGTEPVFRIMCDVKGENVRMERALLEWEADLIKLADNNNN